VHVTVLAVADLSAGAKREGRCFQLKNRRMAGCLILKE
jgi:hypothetical protein